MKTTVVVTFTCLALFSCVDNTLDKSETRLPVLERHYNMETGDAIAEKSFVYDKNQNLIRESYKPLISKVGGYENIYEYDDQHNRILILSRHTSDVASYSIARFTYDGDKKIEEQYYGNDVSARLPHTKVVYYYSGSQPDSSRTLQLFANENDYNYAGASYFKYDIQGRLIEEQRRFYDGSLVAIKMNNYDGELLQQTCNPVTGQEGVFNCTKYEYKSQKKLIRKYATLTGTADKLLEEDTYTEGLLTESKIFDQKYYLPAYNADPTPYTLKIIYEY